MCVRVRVCPPLLSDLNKFMSGMYYVWMYVWMTKIDKPLCMSCIDIIRILDVQENTIVMYEPTYAPSIEYVL